MNILQNFIQILTLQPIKTVRSSQFAVRSSQFAVLIFLLVLVTGFKGYGQTVYPGYLDGQVYVRINGVGNQIPLYNIGDSLNVYPSSIQSIISNYQVIKIKKAFKLRSDTTVDHIYKVVFSDTSNVVALINDFEAIPFTDFAEKVPLYKTFCTNEGANFWTNGNPSNYHLNLTNACNAFPLLSPGNAQIRVAVVDNEFNINHPDLVNKFNPALCWDVSDNDANVQGPLSYNHGTHCAGIIAAENNNNLGVASIGGGWQTINPIELMGIKATPDNLGVGNQIIDGYDAINEAANLGARIISCSWGDQTNSPTATMSIADQIALNQTLNNFTDIILVCAAGNSNTLNNAFPAAATQATAPLISVPNLDRIISVGSIDALSAKSFFSNFGPTVDICAPGTNIFSPIHNGTYQFSSGTSMAAPMVASLLALVAYNNPNFTTPQIINCVLSSATNIDNPNSNFIGFLGAGLINCEAALNCTPSTNISFIINDNTFCRNIPQNINVTIGNLPVGVTVNSIQWNLPGSNIGNANGQNITGLSYPQFGIFPVTIICTLSNLSVQIYNTTFLSLGNINLESTSEMPVCNNSMQQISVVDASSLFIYNYFTSNPIFNPIPPQLSTNFNGTNQSYFQLTNNQTVSLNNVDYNFQNNVFNQTCPLNEVLTYNPMCCEVNTIENGDISAGNTLFTSGVVFSPLCNRPGIYRIDQPTQTLQNEPIGFSNGNRLYYDGPYNFTNFINIPPPSCGPATIINFIPQAPIDTRMHTQLGLSSVIWQQTRTFTSNHDYKFSFLSRHHNNGLFLPFRVRVRIANGMNNIFTSTILLQFQQDYIWNLNEINIQNFPAVTGNYNIIIEQLDNYGDYGFDLEIDDINLQLIYPFQISSPIGTDCLLTGNTTTLTTIIPSSGVANYLWSGPANGIVGPNNTQIITVQLPGVYTVTSTNASPIASNCPILQSTYTVNGTAIDAIVSYNVCVGTITTNIVSSTGSTFTYSLNGGPQQATNIFTGLAAGIYTVVVTDNNGCIGSTIVNLNPAQFAITASASPSSICVSSNSQLTANGANTYVWQPGNLVGANQTLSPTITTTYTVTGSSGINCSATSTVTVTVNPPPTVTATANPYPICLGNQTVLTGGGALTYTWSGGITNGVPFTPSLGLPVYTVTGTDAGGCTNTTSITILVNPLPIINANATPNTVCAGNSVTLTGGGGSITYNWTGGVTDGIPFTPTTTTTYTVTGTDVNGCTSTSSVTVIVNQLPTVSATANPSSICINDNSQLVATGAQTYSWLPVATLNNAIISNPIASPTSTTIYTVTGISTANCSASTTVSVTVLPPNATQCICPQMPVQTFVNPNATDIINFFTTNIITNATFGIDGVLTMDADLTFQVCNIFMAPDAEIQVVGNHTIKFEDNCVVQTPAQCPMWKGIFANGFGNNVVVYGSTFKDMKTGLQIQDDAGLEADGSSFIDNYISIHLKNQSNSYGSITSNTFKTDANFLKDPYLSQKGEHGIILENCSNITVGDPINATNKNHFENLYNGIYIRDAVALSSINTITTSLNTFKNIVGGPSLMGVASPPWGTPYNMQHRGAAIFGNSSIQTNNLWLKHYGNNNSIVDFDACTKAILVNAFNTEIHNNRVASTISAINPEAGFLTYKNEGKVIYIRYNHILNTILGVNLNGTASFCDVHGNTIETNTTYDLSGFPASFFTTTGINVSEFSTIPNQQGKYIDYNTLTINNLAAGEGINVLKTRWGSIHDNVIHFASNDPSADNTSRPSLVGIRLNKVDLSRVMNNNVVLVNHANTAILQNRKTIGIELYESPSNRFDCNTNDYLHWGMQVRGECAIIQPDHFKQNFFRTYYFGIYSTNLSLQGYLGRDIGFYDPTLGGYKFDANNQFANALNASNKRLFRFLPTTTTNCDNAKRVNYHTTSSLNTLINGMPNHSESAGGTGICTDYIDNQSFAPAEIATSCVPIQNNIMGEDGGEPITDNPDVEGMIDIAQDSVHYSEYPELGEWFDERRLMDMLTTHDSLRLQYPILNTFYMQRQQGNLDKLNKIDRYLGMLSDSATIANSANYEYNLQQAIQLNNELNSTEYYVQNEKWINTLYMRRWDVGNDTINETEAEAIDALASACPYVAGNAVYKARMLNAYYFPTKQYNDKVICNAIGVFKNVKGLFDDEEAYLDSIMNVKTNGLVEADVIKVYPNPTQDKVTIEFENILELDALFELMDLSGRVILTKILPQGTRSTIHKLPQIADGLYTYKIAMQKGKAYNGKLIKN